MIKSNILTIFFVLGLFVNHSVLAHGGGHRPINDDQAIVVATDIVHQFMVRDPGLGFGKLGSSWKNLPAKAKRIHKKKADYYIVAITNKKMGKILYVLMSGAGEVYDANFSGVFKGIN